MKNVSLYTIELDAHSIDEEFEISIFKNFGVKIIDRSGEPWSVIFEGTQESLRAMTLQHWGDIKINVSDFQKSDPKN